MNDENISPYQVRNQINNRHFSHEKPTECFDECLNDNRLICSKQRSLKSSFHVEGIGVHSGKFVKIAVHAAPVNTGIIFLRTDLKASRAIFKTHPTLVKQCQMSTRLINDNGDFIQTIEHILAAFAGVGVTNAYVEVEGSEIPILDGSSFPFIELILKSGIVEQKKTTKILKVKRSIALTIGESSLVVLPFDGRKLTCSFDGYGRMDSFLQNSTLHFDFEKDSFIEKIARARTFGFYEDGLKLQENGLALGSSCDNTIVLKDNKIINQEGLRFENEFVRHKLLDLIGDMAVLGMPVLGKIIGHNTGHSFNNRFMRQLLEAKDSFDII
jgi:UDP-3-O-[3-hydroxymyristoyl] N-acetylglucosamine deacetylase